MIGGGEIMANDMNWEVWWKKLGKGLGLTLLASGLIYVANYIDATTFPVEYAFWASLVYTGLSQAGNWIKHSLLA